MTTALTTIQRADPRGSFNRLPSRLGAALAAVGERFAAWSAPYYEQRPGDLADMPREQGLELALRWHARNGRAL